MKLAPVRSLPALTALGLAAMFAVGPSSDAEARTATAQAAYECAAMFDGQENTQVAGEAGIWTVTASMQLQVPESVAPGQRVPLNGVLALQMPEDLRQSMEGFLDTVEAYSDTASVTLGVNGGTDIHNADRWQTPRQKVGNPFVVKGAIGFPSFTVPSNASGVVKIGLPQNNVVKNPLKARATKNGNQMPDIVAFTGRAQASGAMGTYSYDLACWLKQPTAGIIAQIPVSASGSSGSSTSGTSGSVGGTSGSAGSGTSSSSTAAGSNPDDPFAAAAAAAEDGTLAEGEDGTTAADAQSTATGVALGQGVKVPLWLLATVGVIAIIGSIAYLALTRFRLGLMLKD
ncbi:MAG: hypothetical protein QM621_04700 [Aeromicrobium sp.]|uniref:DUF6801 domain-containing protein n=1 Tax=Aeromicrobium sp. TaxID=1871063 RepID=UPI0039E2875A